MDYSENPRPGLCRIGAHKRKAWSWLDRFLTGIAAQQSSRSSFRASVEFCPMKIAAS
jgi:hypothetical protein